MPDGGMLTLETCNVVIVAPGTGNGTPAYAPAAEHAAPPESLPFAPAPLSMDPGRYVRLTVSDTGAGVSPEVREHLFEPFFTTKSQGKGTGLGLATVYGIVRQSGGYIDVLSDSNRGPGATFRIHLPAVADSPTSAAPPPVGGSIPRGKELVMVVEDQSSVRMFTMNILRDLGYTVLGAASGPEALTLLRRDRPALQLVLTDIMMPEMSGPEFARRLHGEHPEIKVVYMSGHSSDFARHSQGLEAGTFLLQKPFTLDSLARKLREALDEHP
jgi:two-component system, cell cycle sensor histidine kinase and response regulator CckA